MMMPPVAALIADTLLVRPVDVPTPWYSVASGVLSIVVTLLLLGIAVALLGMARALKGAERNLGGRLQGLADELIPLARNLNQIATQLGEVTAEARGDLRKLSGTIGAVDDAVRDALAAGESRLHQFGTMLDAVQDEAQATVASATGLMRGVRTGAGAMVSGLFSRGNGARATVRHPQRNGSDAPPQSDADVYARLAALEAAFAAQEEDEDDDTDRSPRFAAADASREAFDSDDDWDDEDDDDFVADTDDELDADEDDDDPLWDDEDDDDGFDDDDDTDEDDADDDDEDDDEDDGDDDTEDDDLVPIDGGGAARPARVSASDAPRVGGPRIRPRGRS